MRTHATAIVSLFLFLFATSCSAINLYVGAKPQSANNTCQSFASVLALAAIKDPAFPIETFAELRRQEASFRAILDAMPGKNSHLVHTNWPKAIEKLTGNVYTFDIEYTADIVDWMTRVKDKATIANNVNAAVASMTGSGFTTVLTSVLKFDGSAYSSGHIITVIGVAGGGFDSSTQLIAFNSAVKGKGGSVRVCSADNEPGDERYTAGVVESRNFELKSFGTGLGYLIMTLRKK